MEKAKPTPTPWSDFRTEGEEMNSYSQSSGVIGQGEHRMKIICGCFNDIGGKEVAAANAAFIVKAVNCHEELLDCLKEVSAEIQSWRETGKPSLTVFMETQGRVLSAIQKATA